MSLILDIAIIALLIGTLIYALIVDRRVRILMSALREIEPMIGNFSEAVDRSEKSVSVLRSLGQNLNSIGTRSPSAREKDEASEPQTRFQTSREKPVRTGNVNTVPLKSELVRGFFETIRSREA